MYKRGILCIETTYVNRSTLTKHYSTDMGRVNEMDPLIAFYRIYLRSVITLFKCVVTNFTLWTWVSVNTAVIQQGHPWYESCFQKIRTFTTLKLVLTSCIRMQNKPLVGKGRPSLSPTNGYQILHLIKKCQKRSERSQNKAYPSKAHQKYSDWPLPSQST